MRSSRIWATVLSTSFLGYPVKYDGSTSTRIFRFEGMSMAATAGFEPTWAATDFAVVLFALGVLALVADGYLVLLRK